ncbi:MAG: hypothetical protein IH621_03560 [Krumholzibacteria bacterium]|nr:hypothetical protein [Candidatus Krumholzibacteria bacterium]
MHDTVADEIQRSVLNRMTCGQRLGLACEMSDLARDLCRARIRQQHPDWTDAEIIREMVRGAFSPQPCTW